MTILGINAYHGDVSAVLIQDGQLVAALEEERFKRIKHVAGFPTEAIRRCLEIGDVSGADVDHVAISRDPKANLGQKARFVITKRPSIKLLWERMRSSGKVMDVKGPLGEALGVDKSDLPPLHNVEHHPAHLASAFFVSPYDEAAVCAIDGMGDFVSTSMAAGKCNSIEVLDKVYFPHSLGILYTAITQYLGFPHYGDEYKVMGLAPYGEPTHLDELRHLVKLTDGGRFELDLKYFRHWSDDFGMDWEEGAPSLGTIYTDELEKLLGPSRDPAEEVAQKHKNIAHSLQVLHEECTFHILNALYEKTGSKRLCLAGGCGMNSVANGKIRDHTPFEEVYIQPAAADNGTALGAAFYVWHQELGRARSFEMDHAFWGTEYPEAPVADPAADLEDEEWDYGWQTYNSDEETCQATAELLADGHVVGWFQGRMEWGARALGNRSILGDPSDPEMRDRINLKIKFREKFRPFAPSILEEALDEYFVGADADPFMQQVYPVQPNKREGLPAITHVDGSGRLQAVQKRTNPKYHRLIEVFGELTGTPILLNTSFNENEPIVDTPEQALDCFFRTQMDAIVIGNVVVRRTRKRAAV